MRGFLQLSGWLAVLCMGIAIAGIDWKAVWFEPATPVTLAVGETQAYTVMGLNGADVKANLTRSPYLKITSSDPDVVEVDRKNAVFVAKKPGKAEIRISFSEATNTAQVFVKERKAD